MFSELQDIELVWSAPAKTPLSSYSFKRELYVSACMRRQFFKQNKTGIPNNIYSPLLEAFKDAFKAFLNDNFSGSNIIKLSGRMFYPNEISLSFDLSSYTNTGAVHFFIVPNEYKHRFIVFYIETAEQWIERTSRFVVENILYIPPYMILHSLVENAFISKTKVDYVELQNKYLEDRDFETDDCPVCFENLVDRFTGKCGHKVCIYCLKNLIKTQRSALVCPVCRDDWCCYNVVEEGERYVNTEEDIDDLQQQEEETLLLDNINLPLLQEILNLNNMLEFGYFDGIKCKSNQNLRWSLEDFAIVDTNLNLIYENI